MSDVKIEKLKVKYDDKVVFDDFSLSLAQDKINVILGGSGIGKTTLLNAVAGLVAYEGTISEIDGGISYIFQKDRLIPSISVYKNLDLVLKSVFADKNQRRKMIEDMLDGLEIADCIDKKPTEISGGQAQRVALARAYLYPCKVLLLDEPFKGLDTSLKTRVLSSFIRLNEKSPKTVLFVTHAIDECLLTADRYFVLGGSPATVTERGEITQDKLSRSLSSEEMAKVRQNLLQSI